MNFIIIAAGRIRYSGIERLIITEFLSVTPIKYCGAFPQGVYIRDIVGPQKVLCISNIDTAIEFISNSISILHIENSTLLVSESQREF